MIANIPDYKLETILFPDRSLKVEYCDLENVFKSTAIFDHFYDHMLTFF